jgi:hypothetical protein
MDDFNIEDPVKSYDEVVPLPTKLVRNKTIRPILPKKQNRPKEEAVKVSSYITPKPSNKKKKSTTKLEPLKVKRRYTYGNEAEMCKSEIKKVDEIDKEVLEMYSKEGFKNLCPNCIDELREGLRGSFQSPLAANNKKSKEMNMEIDGVKINVKELFDYDINESETESDSDITESD